MTTIALFGAAGKMGTRISNNLSGHQEYRMLYIEEGEAGKTRLKELGLTATSKEEAVSEADIVILAVPDMALGSIATGIVPSLNSGAMVVCLDPAAPHGGELPERDDISYFVVHPCHPPLINDETDPEARKDFFGGTKAKQHIVCSLMQGPESDYSRGEALSRRMFAPVMKAHRITVEQMALLEPAMTETVALTCLSVIHEAMDEVIRCGVPPEAARDFMMGHLNAIIGIVFGYIDAEVSDGAKLMMERAKKQIFQPNWKDVFKAENVMEQVEAIIAGTPES